MRQDGRQTGTSDILPLADVREVRFSKGSPLGVGPRTLTARPEFSTTCGWQRCGADTYAGVPFRTPGRGVGNDRLGRLSERITVQANADRQTARGGQGLVTTDPLKRLLYAQIATSA